MCLLNSENSLSPLFMFVCRSLYPVGGPFALSTVRIRNRHYIILDTSDRRGPISSIRSIQGTPKACQKRKNIRANTNNNMVDFEISKDHRWLYEHLTAFNRKIFCRSIMHLFLPCFSSSVLNSSKAKRLTASFSFFSFFWTY